MILEKTHDLADLKALSVDEARTLASEVRGHLIEGIARTGGHLSVNLGAVELNLAMYRVFDSPRDIVIWAGHETYTQKLFTDRRETFNTLRQPGGLSGFTEPSESAHDWTCNTHVSIGPSYAHGLSRAVEAAGEARRVVVSIGDGGLTGGMAYEALSNLGYHGAPVVVVLNDNGRSYAPTVSRLSVALDELRTSRAYVEGTRRIADALDGDENAGERLRRAVSTLDDDAAADVAPFFETLGLRYVGPVDGHDLPALEQALREASGYDGPVLVHVLTEKGHGYQPARADQEKRLHDVTPFDPRTGPAPARGEPLYTDVFGEALVRIARRDGRVHAVVAAMPGSAGLLPFEAEFPDRFLDVGIAEQHAVGAAAGMAMGGLRPVVAIFSTFFMRAFDQANLDVGMMRLPVVFCIDRAGITGSDGPSHNGVLDIALMTKVAGMTVFAPSSAQELEEMLAFALTRDGPSVIRYPKAVAPQVAANEVGQGLDTRRVRSGRHVCFIACGKLLAPAVAAAEELERRGVSTTVWDPRVISPLDRAMVADACGHQLVVTVEDGMRYGGLGSEVAAAVASQSDYVQGPSVLPLGTPRAWIPQGKPDALLAGFGLDGPSIARTVWDTWSRRHSASAETSPALAW